MASDVLPVRSWFGQLVERARAPGLPEAAALPPDTPAETPSADTLPQAAHPEAPELDVLADIDFSETGGGNSFLADGWSHQEPAFIWALGQSSDVFLPDTSGWSDVTLDLDLFPCILPPYRTVQRLHVFAGKNEIGRTDVKAPGRVEIASPDGMSWMGVASASPSGASQSAAAARAAPGPWAGLCRMRRHCRTVPTFRTRTLSCSSRVWGAPRRAANSACSSGNSARNP
jgi:hypothetical protein